VAYLSAAILIAAAMDGVGARARDLDQAHAEAWFWSFPDDNPKPKQFARQVLTPNPKAFDKRVLGTKRRGPNWFWSFTREKPKPEPERVISFSGADLWRQGAFLYGGGLWAPAGLDRDGLVIKLIETNGIYRYRSGLLGDASVTGLMFAASVMPGLHFTRGGVSVTVYAGLDYQIHWLIPDDAGNSARGVHKGVRGAVDLWYQPTEQTMIAASATLTTIANAHALRLAGGFRLLDNFYVGPEAMLYGADNYRQLRFGAHVTGLKLLWVEWQAGVGYALDDDGNAGLYARLGVSERW
jgi:hypothetical protein